MKVEFDRLSCAGWFQCVQEWDAFEMNVVQGKADLTQSKEVDNVFIREIPTEFIDEARLAAEACPVDAITIIHDDNE